MKANPLGGACMAKGIVLEKVYVHCDRCVPAQHRRVFDRLPRSACARVKVAADSSAQVRRRRVLTTSSCVFSCLPAVATAALRPSSPTLPSERLSECSSSRTARRLPPSSPATVACTSLTRTYAYLSILSAPPCFAAAGCSLRAGVLIDVSFFDFFQPCAG